VEIGGVLAAQVIGFYVEMRQARGQCCQQSCAETVQLELLDAQHAFWVPEHRQGLEQLLLVLT
jgi:hypothetical protein